MAYLCANIINKKKKQVFKINKFKFKFKKLYLFEILYYKYYNLILHFILYSKNKTNFAMDITTNMTQHQIICYDINMYKS